MKNIFQILIFALLLTSCSVKWANNIAEKGHREELINNHEGAMKIYNSGIKWNKNSAELYWRRGNLHARNENHNLAIIDLTKSIEIDSVFNTGYAYWDRAISKENLGDLVGALSDFDNAILINPNKSNFYFFRGTLKYKLADYNGSHADFNNAINIWNNYYLARSWRSTLRVELKDYNGAMEDYKYLRFTKKDENNPNKAWKYRYRGIAKFKTGDKIGGCKDWIIAARHGDSISNNRIKKYCKK
ncbi:tetratricopeptide repeat protein [Tenacibaculum ovolyticum]|uniref:tetratricopeptide repeat protein n=1 Tax=Tenacibaculum ovolyticum TaxID=104270 RepID=UPI0004149EC3|nr:hypothetical protein [Tenacibaculum ovolyticum]